LVVFYFWLNQFFIERMLFENLFKFLKKRRKVSEGDQHYSVARIATLVAKRQSVSEGDEHKQLNVRHLQRLIGCSKQSSGFTLRYIVSLRWRRKPKSKQNLI
jgi:hypothetical protein